MLGRIVAAGRKTGVPTGMHTMSIADAGRRAEQGMQFIALGSDLRMLTEKSAEWVAALHPGRSGGDLARY